jgi:hypothetical protein
LSSPQNYERYRLKTKGAVPPHLLFLLNIGIEAEGEAKQAACRTFLDKQNGFACFRQITNEH